MSRSRWAAFGLALCVALAASVTACGGYDDDGSAAPASTSPAATGSQTEEPLEGELVVFAASSLTDAFNELAEAFTGEHPGVSVTFNFAASSALATQIDEGAPADVFASADNNQMQVVIDAGNATGPEQFATNLPVIIVPADGGTVAGFEDLGNPGTRVIFAAPEVPIGRYSREILVKASADPSGPGADFAARVEANVVSNEANVRAVLTKIQLGEGDAGIVYSTDATVGADDVETIEIPAAYNVIAVYPIVALHDAENARAAAAWIKFVLSDDGQEILAGFGFGAP